MKQSQDYTQTPGDMNPCQHSLTGRRAISGSWDKTVKLWDASNGKEVCTLGEELGDIYAVCLSSDDKLALSGSAEGKIILWQLEVAETPEEPLAEAVPEETPAAETTVEASTVEGGTEAEDAETTDKAEKQSE